MIYSLCACVFLTIVLFAIYIGKKNKLSEELVPNINIQSDNVSICKDMLKIIGNNHTEVAYNKDKNSNLSYYNHSKDVIILKNNSLDSSRITQIAHECIHTIQESKYLKANKFFSDLQLIMFVAFFIFIITTKINEMVLVMFQLLILIGTLFAKVVIEGDATYRSIDLAEKYLISRVDKKEVMNYVCEMRRLIYKLMPIYYMNFYIQGMTMIIINIVIALIFR